MKIFFLLIVIINSINGIEIYIDPQTNFQYSNGSFQKPYDKIKTGIENNVSNSEILIIYVQNEANIIENNNIYNLFSEITFKTYKNNGLKANLFLNSNQYIIEGKITYENFNFKSAKNNYNEYNFFLKKNGLIKLINCDFSNFVTEPIFKYVFVVIDNAELNFTNVSLSEFKNPNFLSFIYSNSTNLIEINNLSIYNCNFIQQNIIFNKNSKILLNEISFKNITFLNSIVFDFYLSNSNIHKFKLLNCIFNDSVLFKISDNNILNIIDSFFKDNESFQKNQTNNTGFIIKANLISNFDLLMKNCYYEDNKGEYSFFFIENIQKGIFSFENNTFIKNSGYSIYNLNNMNKISFIDIKCVLNNIKNSKQLNYGTCIFINNVEIQIYQNLNISKCQSNSIASGLVIMETDSLINSQSNITIFDSIFQDNNVKYSLFDYTGGAIYISIGTSLYIYNSVFDKNSIDTNSETVPQGGACINSLGIANNITIKKSNFTQNKAIYYGNCLFFSGNQIIISDSIFSENSNIESLLYSFNILYLGVGGVMYNSGFITIIENCIFSKNSNKNGGVFAFSLNLDTLKNLITIINTKFVENKADELGGVIHFAPGFVIFNATITNCNFLKNYAKLKGGIYYSTFFSYQLVFFSIKCNYTENYAEQGGIYYSYNYIANLTFTNNIFVKNYATKINENSILNSVYGGVFIFNGKNKHSIFINYCQFLDNWSEYDCAVMYTLTSCTVIDTGSVYMNNSAYKNTVISRKFFSSATIYYSTFIDNVAYDQKYIVNMLEFPILTIVGATFKNINNKIPCSVIFGLNNGYYTVMNSVFSGFNSYNEGSLFSVGNLKIGRTLFSVNKIENCSTSGSFFYIDNSNPNTIDSITFTNMRGRLLKITQKTNVLINNGNFTNISCLFPENYQFGCIVYLDSLASITLQNINVINITNKEYPGAFYLENSNITLINFILINSFSESGIGCLEAVNSFVFINNSNMINFTHGCMKFEQSTIEIRNSKFINYGIKNKYEFILKPIIECIECLSMILINNNFEGNVNNSDNGGAIRFLSINAKINQNYYGLIVNNTNFSYISATKNGGCFYILNDFILISNCNFIGNSAGNGGVIYFSKPYQFELSNFYLINNKFLSNSANQEGGVAKITGMIIISQKNIFSNNYAFYGPIIASYPVKMNISIPNLELMDKRSNKIIYSHGVTGTPLNISFNILIIDIFNQIIHTLINEVAQISLNKSSENTINIKDFIFETKESVMIENGQCFFDNITIYSDPPNSNLTLQFFSSSINNNFLKPQTDLNESLLNIQSEMRPFMGLDKGDINTETSYQFLIYINLRYCIQGEIFNKITKCCTQCGYKSFSFNSSDSVCTDCPQNAVCFGGTNISLYEGYWRSSNISLAIHKCIPYGASCLGLDKSLCANGYVGPLCQTCDVENSEVKYIKTSDDVCIPCADPSESIPEIVLKTLIILLFYLFIIWTTISNLKFIAEKKTDKKSLKMLSLMNKTIYMKIFLNYLQVISLSKGFNLNWPETIQSLFKAQGQVSQITQQILALDCFISSGFPIKGIYFKATIAALIPFITNFLILIIWLIVSILQRRFSKSSLITTIVITNFILQPSVIDMMTRILSCQEVDSNKFYISSQLSEECFTAEHENYRNYLSLPLLLLWCLVLPGIVLITMINNKSHLTEKFMASKFGFFYFGYKEKYFYWEFILMFRKILIIFIAVFLISNNSLKALLALLVLAISLFIQNTTNPFQTDDLNTMEFRSSLVSLSTLYFGFFNYLIMSTLTKIILFIIIAIVNCYFLLYWSFKMILINIGKLHLFIKKLLKKFFPSFVIKYKNFFKKTVKPFLIKNKVFNQSMEKSSHSPTTNHDIGSIASNKSIKEKNIKKNTLTKY